MSRRQSAETLLLRCVQLAGHYTISCGFDPCNPVFRVSLAPGPTL